MHKPYTYDPTKSARNLQKHHISFSSAFKALKDPDRITYYDEKHSGYNKYGVFEKRWIAIGKVDSAGRKVLFVSYCVRDGEIRIISARKASKRMKRLYEGGS